MCRARTSDRCQWMWFCAGVLGVLRADRALRRIVGECARGNCGSTTFERALAPLNAANRQSGAGAASHSPNLPRI